MMPQRLALLRRLAGGDLLSAEPLARELGIGVEALGRELEGFRERGLEVESLARGRVRLRSPLEVLDRDAVLASLGIGSRSVLESLEVLFEVASTNQYLLDLARSAEVPARCVCLAEMQSAGRGRGGRPFFSTLGGNILLSLLWPVAAPPASLLGLSPAVAVAVARALESEGVEGVGLKWPNDVLVRGRKVSGILLELGQDRRERGVLVAGIGINVRLAAATGQGIDQPWTDLHRALGRTPSRNRLAGRVIDQVIEAVLAYFREGFEPFRAEYRARDLLEGRELRLSQAPRELRGIGRGLDERGALLVEAEGPHRDSVRRRERPARGMMLLCDLGNTRLKWALASARGRLREWGAVEHEGRWPAAALEGSLPRLAAVERVVACSVAPAALDEGLGAWLRRRCSVAPEWMPARRRGWGVQCAYATPATMGADRWAMLVAVRRRSPRGACVASCGTAVTVDLLDGGGRHLGGVIMPGLSLMRRSLTENTALIAPVAGKVSSFPDNTPDAVATGTALAAACAIDRFFAELGELAGPDAECILSGGDAEEVRGLMTHRAVVLPCLVLEGLAVMACQEP